MTRKEAQRLTHQENVLLDLGFERDEAEQLRRISMTLHRWYERECGDGAGCIERDDETGKPIWRSAYKGHTYPIPDREAGAKRRLERIISTRNGRSLPGPLAYYLQTDPRGAALYLIRPGDVPGGASVESYYSRGICIY